MLGKAGQDTTLKAKLDVRFILLENVHNGKVGLNEERGFSLAYIPIDKLGYYESAFNFLAQSKKAGPLETGQPFQI